jgi:hypothetical protein
MIQPLIDASALAASDEVLMKAITDRFETHIEQQPDS